MVPAASTVGPAQDCDQVCSTQGTPQQRQEVSGRSLVESGRTNAAALLPFHLHCLIRMLVRRQRALNSGFLLHILPASYEHASDCQCHTMRKCKIVHLVHSIRSPAAHSCCRWGLGVGLSAAGAMALTAAVFTSAGADNWQWVALQRPAFY